MSAKFLELLCMGGASIVCWFAAFLFVDRKASVDTVFIFSWCLAFVVNYPHFLGSYALLYSDFRGEILKSPRYFWAAILAPGALIGYLGYAIYHQRSDLIGLSVNLMFFLVGWHYIKQIFGCIIVGAVRSGTFYTRIERWAILANLFSVWLCSLSMGPYQAKTNEYFGIKYFVPASTASHQAAMHGLVLITGLLLILVLIQKYLRDGTKPSAMGVVAFISIYLWFLPPLSHPVFNYMVPFFHSLQYLVLAGQFKYNREAHQLKGLSGEAWRRAWLNRFVGYWAVVAILGGLFFEAIPYMLDQQKLFGSLSELGPTPFMASFLVFLNVHHYFIDNVIWRSDNAEVRQFLFNSGARHLSSQSETAPQPFDTRQLATTRGVLGDI